MSDDDRVVPFNRGSEPSTIPVGCYLQTLTAAVNAQNLPAQLYNADAITRDEAEALQRAAEAYIANVRRHLTPEMNAAWPEWLDWKD